MMAVIQRLLLLLLYYGFCWQPGSSLPVSTDVDDFSGDSSSQVMQSNVLMPYTESIELVATTAQIMMTSSESFSSSQTVLEIVTSPTTSARPMDTSNVPSTSATLDTTSGSMDTATIEPVGTTSVPIDTTSGSMNTATIEPVGTTSVPIDTTSGSIDATIIEPVGTTSVPIDTTSGSIDATIIEPVGTTSVLIDTTSGSIDATIIEPVGTTSVPIDTTSGSIDATIIEPVGTTSVPIDTTSFAPSVTMSSNAEFSVTQTPVESTSIQLFTTTTLTDALVMPTQTIFSTTPSPSIVLGQSPNVSIAVVNSTAVKVSWSRVSTAIGYRIVIRSQSNTGVKRSTHPLIIRVNDTILSYVVTNLLPGNNYTIQVVVVLSGGIEGPSSLVYSFTTGEEAGEPPGSLPTVAAAFIGITCSLLILILISALVAAILLLLWRKSKTAECDIEVNGEMVYKSGGGAEDIANLSSETDNDPGLQLTAKRWMRANANYSTSSVLLPPMPQLIYSYTAEDVVEANTMVAKPLPPTGLACIPETIPESPIKEDAPPSASSSTERSQETPSTMSSVCSRSHIEVQRVTPLQEETEDEQVDDGHQPLFDMMETVYQASPKEAGSLLKFEVDESDVTLKEQTGIGESGKVTRAIVKKLPLEKNSTDVIVTAKILKGETTEDQKDDFVGAAYILSQFSHDNVLQLLGVCTLSSPVMMLVTYMSNGDLKKYLTRIRRRTRIENQQCDIGLSDQLRMAIQIASGMEYLSSKFFIHRALQAASIMVGDNLSLKIGGFRRSRTLGRPNSFDRLKEANKLPMKWMAIESLQEKKFSRYNDVWSYGVVLWEVFSYGLTPYRGIENNDVLGHLQDGKRLMKPSDCPEDMYTLMLHCWNEQRQQRPSFKLLEQHFTNMLAALSATAGTGLSTL